MVTLAFLLELISPGFRKAVNDNGIGMVNPFFQLCIFDASPKIYPVPMLLVKVVRRGNFQVLFTKFNGQLRIVFQADAPAVFRQVEQGKHLPCHLEDQVSVIEREAF